MNLNFEFHKQSIPTNLQCMLGCLPAGGAEWNLDVYAFRRAATTVRLNFISTTNWIKKKASDQAKERARGRAKKRSLSAGGKLMNQHSFKGSNSPSVARSVPGDP